MRRPAARTGLCFLAVLTAGCARPPDETLQGLFGAAPPAGVTFAHYYGEGHGMDPTFAWVLTPVDEVYLKKLIAVNTLAPAKNLPTARYNFPRWWDHDFLESLPEAYTNDSGGGGLRHVWVDRKAGRIYLEFIGH